MTISPNIITDLANLQMQVAAAAPVAEASAPTLKALQLNAITLQNDILSDLTTVQNPTTSSIGNLDKPNLPIDPGGMVSEFLILCGNAEDQASLATMYGYIGRSLINLEQFLA